MANKTETKAADIFAQQAAQNAPQASPAEQQVEHIEATFIGKYYGGPNGKDEKTPYKVSVKVPMRWLNEPDLHPQYLFRRFYADRVLTQLPGYNGLHSVELHSTSLLPEYLPIKQVLNWECDYGKLMQIANRQGVTHVVLDPETPEERTEVRLETALYANAGELRAAIRLMLTDPIALHYSQARMRVLGKGQHQNLEAELTALGY